MANLQFNSGTTGRAASLSYRFFDDDGAWNGAAVTANIAEVDTTGVYVAESVTIPAGAVGVYWADSGIASNNATEQLLMNGGYVEETLAAILVDTGTTLDGRIPAALVGGRMDSSVGAVANGAITAAAIADGAIDAATFAAGAIDAAAVAADAGTEIATAVWASGTRVLTAGTNIVLPANGLSNVVAWTVAITGNITGNLSGSVGSVTGAVGSVTGNLGGSLTASERNSIADSLLDRADAIETSVTPRGAMRAFLAGLAGVATGGNTTTIVLKNPAGDTTRVSLTVDSDGNRSASTLNV